jgi:hypothetical protein
MKNTLYTGSFVYSDGIIIMISKNNSILNNTIVVTANHRGSGVHIYHSFNITVANNTIDSGDDTASSIYVARSLNISVLNNSVKHSNYCPVFNYFCQAVLISSSNSTIVSNNLIQGGGGCAIAIILYPAYITSSNFNIIQNNSISNSTECGINITGSGQNNAITFNNIFNNSIGIRSDSPNNFVYKNNIYNNTNYFVFLDSGTLNLTFGGDGNYWGRDSITQCFVAGIDSNWANTTDGSCYPELNSWLWWYKLVGDNATYDFRALNGTTLGLDVAAYYHKGNNTVTVFNRSSGALGLTYDFNFTAQPSASALNLITGNFSGRGFILILNASVTGNLTAKKIYVERINNSGVVCVNDSLGVTIAGLQALNYTNCLDKRVPTQFYINGRHYYEITGLANSGAVEIYDPNIHPPIYRNHTLSPASGYSGTKYTFTVNFSDAVNTSLAFVYVNVNGANYTMAEGAGSFSTGKLYTVTITRLNIGTGTYYFIASDGLNTTVTSSFSGPEVSGVFKQTVTIVVPGIGLFEAMTVFLIGLIVFIVIKLIRQA